ncbi:hypothetical protein CISIN_1g042220mg, partial [Citrus sinensis]
YDKSAACISDNDQKMTALLLAAGRGHIRVVNEIISTCPDCCKQVDERGWNLLHFAMASSNLFQLHSRLRNRSVEMLINKQDVNGNTPLHVLAAVLQKEKTAVEEGEIKELKPRHTIVATLIATVTFAAGFTLPGGYWGKEGPIPGTSILIKNAAFQAFVVSDVIAMVLSLSAVFIHFLTSTKTLRQIWFLFNVAHYSLMASMLAMVVAFVTGTYAMLAPSVGLSVATCVLGLSFILVAFFAMSKFEVVCIYTSSS